MKPEISIMILAEIHKALRRDDRLHICIMLMFAYDVFRMQFVSISVHFVERNWI